MPIVTNIGLDGVAESLFNAISHIAIGTGTADENEDDEALETETFRIAPDSKTVEDRLITIRVFFRNNDLPNEITEVGIFLRGTGDADSGNLLARWITSIFSNVNDLTLWLYLEVVRVEEEVLSSP